MFVGVDVAGGVSADVDVVDHPSEHLVPAVLDPALEGELHQLLARRGHVFEALTERHHGEAQSLEVLAHLHRAPPVVGDLPNVVAGAEFLNEGFDRGVGAEFPGLFLFVVVLGGVRRVVAG